MKKDLHIRLVIAFVAIWCIYAPLGGMAQTQVVSGRSRRFALDLSYELAIPSGSHGLWDTGSGVALTGTYAWHPAPRWTLMPGIAAYYNTMGADYMYADHAVYDSTVKNFGLRIPLMAAYDIVDNETFKFMVATGPWLNINMYARQYAMPDVGAAVPTPPSINLFGNGFKRVEGLWGLVLSATFHDHYTIGITSSVAFTPLASYGNHDNKIRIRRHTLAISLGYKF